MHIGLNYYFKSLVFFFLNLIYFEIRNEMNMSLYLSISKTQDDGNQEAL